MPAIYLKTPVRIWPLAFFLVFPATVKVRLSYEKLGKFLYHFGFPRWYFLSLPLSEDLQKTLLSLANIPFFDFQLQLANEQSLPCLESFL